jgi:hypothetical protein
LRPPQESGLAKHSGGAGRIDARCARKISRAVARLTLLSISIVAHAALEGVWRCKHQDWTVIEERPMNENEKARLRKGQ